MNVITILNVTLLRRHISRRYTIASSYFTSLHYCVVVFHVFTLLRRRHLVHHSLLYIETQITLLIDSFIR